jgi:uncharacterized protein (DUF362 family)
MAFNPLHHLEVLALQAHPDGGWGYTADQLAQVEPTCLALLALSLEPDHFATPIAQGREVLGRCALADGSYRSAHGREEAIWPTALVLFVQAALGYPQEEVRGTAARLLGIQGRVPDDPRAAEMHDIDSRLQGWPWAENNFAWAEPTAWACLALRRAGWGEHPRVKEGLDLLLDRALDEGGINYGNRRVFGRLTVPLVEPTALLLLACQGRGPHPRIDSAIQYLAAKALASDDLEQLGWARLALSTYRESPDAARILAALDQRIPEACQRRADRKWLKPSPVRAALTALALASDRQNAFLLTESGFKEDLTGKASATSPSWAQRFTSTIRGLILEKTGSLRPLPARAEVHIANVSDYQVNLAGILHEQYGLFRERVPLAGKRVVLKPNLVEYHRDKVINTHPLVVAAAIELCRREGAREVVVAEGPGHCRNVEYLVEASGLGEILQHYQVSFVDLNHDEPVRCLNLGRLTKLDYLYLARTVVSADVVISLAKLKAHHWAGATLSLKNLFGTLPGICYGWPKNELHWRGIDQSIVDIALTRTPHLAIVDGIIGMEGDGPLNGTPKALGALVMGIDPLAVDATCCRLMQLDPEKIGYLMLGERKRLGLLKESFIDQRGETIAALAQPFATLPHLQALYLRRPA